jgi:hypothetical protein
LFLLEKGEVPMKKIIIIAILLSTQFFMLTAQEYPEGSPRFASTSGDKVLFRYKFTPGQKVSINMSMDTMMKSSSQTGEMEMPFKMTFDASYKVNNVNAEGAAEATLVISHMTMKATGAMDITYDSADPQNSSDSQFAAINVMVNVPIPVQISPLGELISMDTDPLLQAAQKMGTQIDLAQFKQQTKELTESSFIQLSADPLKAGDLYDAGTISTTFGETSTMQANVKYKLIAVSGDKKQAILQPMVTFSFPGMNLKQSNFKGWILFDLEKGNVKESYGKQILEIGFEQGDAESSFLIEMAVNFKTDI